MALVCDETFRIRLSLIYECEYKMVIFVLFMSDLFAVSIIGFNTVAHYCTVTLASKCFFEQSYKYNITKSIRKNGVVDRTWPSCSFNYTFIVSHKKI